MDNKNQNLGQPQANPNPTSIDTPQTGTPPGDGVPKNFPDSSKIYPTAVDPKKDLSYQQMSPKIPEETHKSKKLIMILMLVVVVIAAIGAAFAFAKQKI